MSLRGWLRISSAALLILESAAANAAPIFLGLGMLPDAGGSEASDISADGTTVVGTSGTAFRWTLAEGMLDLGVLPRGRFGSYGAGVSGDGSVVVGESSARHPGIPRLDVAEAFRWTASSGMQGLGFLGDQYPSSAANAVSSDGQVVVGNFGNPASAFRWDPLSGMQAIIGGGSASDVSADGDEVVGFRHVPPSVGDPGGSTEAYFWSAATGLLPLGDFPGGNFESQARAISADGSTVLGFGRTEFGYEAFRWTAATGMVGLGDLGGGGGFSTAKDLSGDGSIVIGHGHGPLGGTRFIWDAAHGMRDLEAVFLDFGFDFSGWDLGTLIGISEDGTAIVGSGRNPLGLNEAWIAVIPEPASGLSLGLGLALLAAARTPRGRPGSACVGFTLRG